MNFAGLLRSALANHVVAVFNLAGVNVVDLLVGVILTDPFRRAVVHTGLLQTRTRLTNRQRRLLLTASFNSTFPARLLGGSGSLLPEHRRSRERKYQRKHQNPFLLHPFFLLIISRHSHPHLPRSPTPSPH